MILLQTVLPDDVNRGYQDWEEKIVRLVNGQPPRDMTHLASLIDKAKGPWLRIVTEDGSLLTMDIKAAREAHRSILDYHGVSQDRYLATEPRVARSERRRRR